MTTSVLTRAGTGSREASPRHYLMCPPTFFDVSYVINPWMHAGPPVDRARALDQWSALVASYRAHGHQVDLLEPVEGLPDLVFTANGATVVDGQVLQARFAGRTWQMIRCAALVSRACCWLMVPLKPATCAGAEKAVSVVTAKTVAKIVVFMAGSRCCDPVRWSGRIASPVTPP